MSGYPPHMSMLAYRAYVNATFRNDTYIDALDQAGHLRTVRVTGPMDPDRTVVMGTDGRVRPFDKSRGDTEERILGVLIADPCGCPPNAQLPIERATPRPSWWRRLWAWVNRP